MALLSEPMMRLEALKLSLKFDGRVLYSGTKRDD